MNLAVYVDAAGKLIDFHLVKSNETPAYLEMLNSWWKSLYGRRLFESRPFANVDAVTGATVSSEAVLVALQTSGHKFAADILGKPLQADIEQEPFWADYMPDLRGIYLIIALIFTLIVIYHGGFWSRLAVLLFNLVAGGVILNAQYSTEQIVTALSFQTPAIKLSAAFLLVIGVPILVLLFGNIYCGYLCPFGAAQELMSYILPEKFKPSIPAVQAGKARFVKYVILFVLIILFFLSRNRTTLAADPLIRVFDFRITIHDLWSSVMLVSVLALIGSIFYPRFWCLYLCPAGAFLSLFNKAVLLKKYLPAKRFGKCDFGITARDDFNCIHCDRCRYRKSELKAVGVKEYKTSRLLVPCVLILVIIVTGIAVNRFWDVIPAGFEQPAFLTSSGGEPRDVDLQRIRTMIQQKKLSDHEAEFYEKLE